MIPALNLEQPLWLLGLWLLPVLGLADTELATESL